MPTITHDSRVKVPMNGLPSVDLTTSCLEKQPEKVDRLARSVIFKTAGVPTKDHAVTQGWVELYVAKKDTRASPCWSPEHGVNEEELP